MVTRALHDSGLHLIGSDAEQFIDAAEDNPEGFWENKAIVACNDELLEATGGAWDNPPSAMPLALDDPRVAHIADSSAAAIAALSEYDHWGFKDPRTCLTAAYWLDLVPDLHFVICVRHPLEVALSLKRRNQNSYSLGLRLWERYYATVLELVPVDRRILTHYDTFFLDPREELARLCAFAGLKPATPRVRSDLRHHTIGVGLDDAGVSENLRRLYDALCREAGAPVLSEPPSDEGRVRRLILDGAVATRHAEQRQDAIDRLHEREEEARADRAAAEAELRARVRDLELELGRSRRDAATQLANQRIAAEVELRERVGQAEARTAAARDEARAMHDATIAAIRALGDTFARSESKLADIDRQIRGTSGRVDQVITALQPGPVRKAAKRSAGKAVRGSKRLRRFIYASTSSVYGRYAAGDEMLPPRPISPYGVTKLAAENLCRAYAEEQGLPLVVLRYFSVYGPRQRPDMGYHKFVAALLAGRPITVYGDGQQVRGNTYVTDCVEATAMAIGALPGETYNVGGGEAVALWDVIRKLEALTGRRTEIIHQPPRSGDQRSTSADTAKLTRHLGWVSRIGLDEGLARQVEWQRTAAPLAA